MKKEDNKVDSFFGRNKKTTKTKIFSTKDKEGNIKSKFSLKNKILEKNESGLAVGNKDDLSVLKGVGPAIIKVLNKNGIRSFEQLIKIGASELKTIIGEVRGSHRPEEWIKQAKNILLENKLKDKQVISSVKSKNKKKKSLYFGNDSVKKERQKKTLVNKNTVETKLFTEEKIPRKNDKNDIDSGVKRGGLLKSINNIILVSLFFIIGLFFVRQTFQGIDFEKSSLFYLVVVIVAGLTIINFLFKKNIRIRKTPFDIILAIFVLLYGISAWFSVDRWHSLTGFFGDPSRGIIFILAMLFVFYLILGNFTISIAKKAWTAIVSSIIILSIYTLISGLGLIPANIQVFIPFTLVGSLKGLATILSAGVPLLVVTYLLLSRWNKKMIAWLFQGSILISLGAIIIDLVILKSFVSWAVVILGLGALAFLLISRWGKSLGERFGRITILTILTVFVLVAGWAKSDYRNLMPAVAKIGLPTEVHVGLPVSYEIAKNSLLSGWKQGLIGSGPATFGYDFAKFSPKGLVSSVPGVEYLYQGEGVLAEAISTIGILGVILLIGLVIIFIVYVGKVFKVENDKQTYIIGLAISMLMLLANGMVSQINGSMLFITVLLGSLTVFFVSDILAESEYYSVDLRGAFITKFLRAFMIIIILVGLLSSGIYVARAYITDVYFARALNNENIDEKIDGIKRVVEMNPREGVYYTKLGQAFLIKTAQKIKAKEKFSEQEKVQYKNEILGYSKIGATLLPNDVKTQKFLAMAYENLGMNMEAKNIYEKIIELDPNSIIYYIKLGDFYLAKSSDDKQNLDKSLEWYKKALDIQPNAATVYDRMATVFYRKDEVDKAIVSMAKAVAVAPNNLSYKFTLGVLYQLKDDEKDKAIAEKIFKTLLKSYPNNIDILTQLGLLYEQTNHIDQAREQYQQIIEIVGDNDKLKKVKEVFNKFIENLDKGKLNIKQKEVIEDGLNKNEIDSSGSKQKNSNEKSDIEKQKEENLDQGENKNSENIKNIITITVGPEGPINVRAKGSLAGKKITKIKETAQFEKIGENEKWVQIIIPAQGDQSEIKGWVHKKFVTEE